MDDQRPSEQLKPCCHLPAVEYWVRKKDYLSDKSYYGLCEEHAHHAQFIKDVYIQFTHWQDAEHHLLLKQLFGDDDVNVTTHSTE